MESGLLKHFHGPHRPLLVPGRAHADTVDKFVHPLRVTSKERSSQRTDDREYMSFLFGSRETLARYFL